MDQPSTTTTTAADADIALAGQERWLDKLSRAEIQELLKVADLLWEEAHGAPPLEDDPVAATPRRSS